MADPKCRLVELFGMHAKQNFIPFIPFIPLMTDAETFLGYNEIVGDKFCHIMNTP